MRDGRLYQNEAFWRDLVPWLEEQGYILRPRYQANWVASWKTSGKKWRDSEDGQIRKMSHVMDATRVSDQATVVLKKIRLSSHPSEVAIGQMFSSKPLSIEPQNHCVPIYEVLPVPGEEDAAFLVMPFLTNAYQPEFETVGEVVEFFKQIFEGLQFMHRQRVAHRDCKWNNIMMDSSHLYREPIHPADNTRTRDFTRRSRPFTRTRRPVRYYLVDFGLSRRYDVTEEHPLDEPFVGGTRGVPEYDAGVLVNPFLVDVYCIGNVVCDLTQGGFNFPPRTGLEFMNSLVADMMHSDPNKRPTMDEVVSRFSKICNELSSWKLRSRFALKDESFVVSIFRSIPHWTKQFVFILKRTPALPRPATGQPL
ncbi:kinase-like domain-containing protein [Infundibulicybe gibba]|nr:kinase-like domain-containing protein [Infundibulicybe gibba]